MLLLWCSVLLLQFLVAGTSAEPVPQCPVEGCAAAVRPVCGSDGLTYMNECLAACQWVSVETRGSCVARSSDVASASAIHIPAALFVAAVDGDVAATSTARILPAAAISAYHAEGMHMVGMLKRSSFQTGMPVVSEDALALMNASSPASVTTMMVNSKGHLYAAPPGTQLWGAAAAHQEHLAGGSAAVLAAPSEATAPVAADTLDTSEDGAVASQPGSGPSDDAALSRSSGGSSSSGDRPAQRVGAAASTQGSRRLQGIIGADTRKELRATPKYPLSAAGHLMFTNPDDSKRYQCSGTLVGTYVVLTAAHCVVARSGQVQQEITFTAAETSHNHAGLGAANGVRVYFNSGYLSMQDWTNWDLGLVVLDQPLGVNSHEAFQQEWQQLQVSVAARRTAGPRPHRGEDGRHGDWGRDTGAAPGTVGYAASPRLEGADLISAGYPGDKPLGSAWMMSCSLTDKGDTSSNVLPNKCPIVNGQSGASLIEGRPKGDGTRYYARGIVSFEVCKSVCDAACCGGKVQYNGVLKITPYFQNFIDSHRNSRPIGDDSDFE